MLKFVLALVISIFTSYFLTPIVIQIAKRFQIYDIPRERRVHKIPTPLLGGVAIALSFYVTCFVLGLFDKYTVGLVLGGFVILGVGILDDVVELKPAYKMLGQIIAAIIMVLGGIKIQFITNFFTHGIFYVGALSSIITVIWVVAFTNIINFIDGLDGLAAGVVAIASATLAILAYCKGHYNICMMLFALFGGCFGFLKYNFNPAKVFMGDTGAMFLGYMLAGISALGAYKGPVALAISIPVFVLGIPIIDTTVAIFRRIKNKTPIHLGDKEHLHHRLLNMGMSQKRAVITIYIGSAALGGCALLMDIFTARWTYILTVFCLLTILIIWARIGLFNSKEKFNDQGENEKQVLK